MESAAASPAPAPSAPAGGAPTGAPSGGGAPNTGPTRGHSAALSTPRAAPAPTGGAPNADAAPSGAVDGAPTESAAAKARHLFKRTREDGGVEEIDITEAIEGYKHKVKVDKVEQEVGLDELSRSYERVRASMKRFEEASTKEKEVQAREARMEERNQKLRAALSDPTQALALVERALGPELFMRAVSQKVAEAVRYERMSPEQRAELDSRRQKETQQQRLERELTERKRTLDAREAQVREAETARAVERIRGEVTAALAQAKLPATQQTIRMVASKRAAAIRAGAPLTLAEAVAETRTELREMMGALSSEPSALRDILGEQGTDAVRESELAELQQQPGRRSPTAPAAPSAGRPRAASAPRSLEEFQRALRGKR